MSDHKLKLPEIVMGSLKFTKPGITAIRLDVEFVEDGKPRRIHIFEKHHRDMAADFRALANLFERWP